MSSSVACHLSLIIALFLISNNNIAYGYIGYVLIGIINIWFLFKLLRYVYLNNKDALIALYIKIKNCFSRCKKTQNSDTKIEN